MHAGVNRKPGEGVGHHGAGVTGICEPLNVDTGNCSWVNFGISVNVARLVFIVSSRTARVTK